MKSINDDGIPNIAIIFTVLSGSVFYSIIFVITKIIIIKLYIIDSRLIRIAISFSPALILMYIMYFWSRSWQRLKLNRKIKLGSTPIIEQIPYMVSFVILYAATIFSFDFINSMVNMTVFSNSDSGLCLALGLGAAMTVRSWDVFVQHYYKEQSTESQEHNA